MRLWLYRRSNNRTLMGHGRPHFCAWGCRPGYTGSGRGRPHFQARNLARNLARNRRPRHYRPSGRPGRDCRSGRRRGHHDPRFLPRLGNDSARRGRGRGWRTLTLHTQVWADLTLRTLAGRNLTGNGISGCRLTRCTRRSICRGCTHGGTTCGRGRWSYAGRLTGQCGWGCWLGRGRGPGRLGRNRNRRPLGYGCSFIFSLLNCLEHVAGFRYARPVDLLLRFALCLCGPGTVLPVPLKVLAYPLCFIFFQRA